MRKRKPWLEKYLNVVLREFITSVLAYLQLLASIDYLKPYMHPLRPKMLPLAAIDLIKVTSIGN